MIRTVTVNRPFCFQTFCWVSWACVMVHSGSDSANAAETPHAAQGIMVGELTHSSALIQVRLTASDTLIDGDVPGLAGKVEFTLMRLDVDFDPAERSVELKLVTAEQSAVAQAEHDFIARVQFSELEPNTRYRCRTRLLADSGATAKGPTAVFSTLPGANIAAPVSLVVVTGMNYAKFHGDFQIDRKQHLEENNIELPPPYAQADKAVGYPALESILKLHPTAFVGTGDNVYYDTPDKGRAKTPETMRRKWHEQFVQSRYRDLFAAVPTYWEIDDHDYRVDDGDNSGDYLPSPETGERIMLEQLPYALHQQPDAKTYRTHRMSQDLQVWLVENRLYRSPNKTEDGPEKTIWGEEQKQWLKSTLTQSDATFKLLISPTPMVGPDDKRKTDNHTNIGGFQHERDEFFAWLNESGLDDQHFYIVCGDRHWQYHAEHPSGVQEFSSGALVDANARLGRLPGDPKSTDPDALIKQFYTQKTPSGGFLQIDVRPAGLFKPAQLRFRFRDENGVVLYRHVKLAEE